MPWTNSILRCATLSKKMRHALMARLTDTLMGRRRVRYIQRRGPEKSLRIRGRSVASLIMGGPLAAIAVVSAQGADTLENYPMITKKTITIEHVRVESAKSFADVRAALERTVPQLDPSLLKALGEGDVERVSREKKGGPELSIFLIRDHGALLKRSEERV